MEEIGQYLLRITAAAILCAMIRSLLGKEGTVAAMGKLLCGLFLAITVLTPWAGLGTVTFSALTGDVSMDAEEAVAVGENAARDALRASIKEGAEAYILDIAASLGAELTVEVTLTLDTPPAPGGARLEGKVSPYARTQLAELMTKELGIPKEAQQWLT